MEDTSKTNKPNEPNEPIADDWIKALNLKLDEAARKLTEKADNETREQKEIERKAAAYDRLHVWLKYRESIGSGLAREIRDALEGK